eukprot:m.51119 g.51119  ORF g.51119 m.51119 type:complete len:99 (-) comp10710_c1_seq1:1310-1606(-)
MDVRRATDEEKYNVCRRYFFGGFFFLPFLWAINAVWFSPYAFHADSDPRIRRMVIISAIGALIWLIVLSVWGTYFQAHRAEWGEMGDKLSANIPKGRA